MHDFQAAFGNLMIDGRAWEVRLDGEIVELTRTEFEILVVLASRPREVISDGELTRAVWGDGWFGDENNLAVHVSKLRRKLGESGLKPRFIRTIRGVGYRFDPGSHEHESRSVTMQSYADLRSLPGAVEVCADAELQIVSIWPEGAHVLGFDPQDLLGRYFPLIADYPWGHYESARDGLHVLISSGVREWVACHVVRRADGHLAQADFATRLNVDDRGRLGSLSFVLVERAWIEVAGGGGGFGESRTSRWSAPSVRA